MINAAITIVISMIVTAVATLLLGFDDPVEELAEETPAVEKKEEEQAPSMRIEIASPVKGTEIPLSEVKDEVFSKNIVGKGAAVIPSEGKVYSPVDGTVASVFDTKHAIGLVSEEGVEVLIHVGLDTVELGGQNFTAHVAQDDKVTKGQLLLEFDMDAIKAAGYDIVTPVVISNTDSYLDVLAADAGEINAGDMLITIVK